MYIREIDEDTFNIEENFPFLVSVYYTFDELLPRAKLFQEVNKENADIP